MFGLGPAELLVLLMMSGGSLGIDVASVLPAKEYFEARDIKPTIGNLVELANVAPTTGKKQIAQLLALRQLAADAELVKKSPKAGEVRELLQQIAQGKKANDATGFAADYAKRALSALDGAKNERRIDAGWKAGADWIPDNVSFFAGVGSGTSTFADTPLSYLTPVLAQMPKDAKEKLFAAIEKIGNVRVDRVVVGVREEKKDSIEFFVRVTGKINSDWFMEVFKEDVGKVEDRMGVDGLKIHIFRPLRLGGSGPAMALVGDSDFLVAGVEEINRNLGAGESARAAGVTSLDKMLALAAKPGADATQGILKADLAKVPARVSAVAVGEVPSLMRVGAPFPMPLKIFAHAQMTANGLDVQIKATMENEGGAKSLVQVAGQGRDAALAQLAKMQGQPLIPGMNVDSISALLRSVQLRSEGSTMYCRLLVPPEVMLSIPALR